MCLFMCYECMHAYRGQKRASKAFTAEVKANLGPLEDQEERVTLYRNSPIPQTLHSLVFLFLF